ncbi:MAG: hypothetical protein JOZ93_15855, partial [Sinobacteraceae bacterium]|nr:hypothetical protein [Nevskiaceae bacterium]
MSSLRFACRALLFTLLSCSVSVRALENAKDLKQYALTTWDTDRGLPQNTVNALLQSRDGYLWIATDGGLARFDGSDFVTYNA